MFLSFEMECVICFEEFTDKLQPITCGIKSCRCSICCSCLEQLVNFSYSSGVLPTCPGNDCDGNFTHRVLIENIKPEVFYTYARTIANYFFKLNEKEIGFMIQKSLTLNKLRVEKLSFMKKAFPSGIFKLAMITSPEKMNKVRRIEVKIRKNTQGQSCPLPGCSGFLKQDTKVCVLCTSRFCNLCMQKRVKGHICKEEDIETLRELNSYIRCPSCTMPIFKDVGCSSVTCGNCYTNFLYQAKCPLCERATDKTQEGSFHCMDCDHVFKLNKETLANKGGHGGMRVDDKKIKKKALFETYNENIEKMEDCKKVFSLLKQLEIDYKPAKSSPKKIKDILINIEMGSQSKEEEEEKKKIVAEKRLLVLLVKAYDNFCYNTFRYRNYIHDLETIENKLIKKKLSCGFLKRVLSKYK